MFRWLAFLTITVSITASAAAQSLSDDIAKAKNIKLLDATEAEVVRLLGNTSPFMYGVKMFSLESSRIQVSYSSGKCTDTASYGVASDDWNVDAGKAVIVEILPRENVKVDRLNLGAVQLRKDRLYPGRDDYHIYYNKRAGIAVTTYGDDEYVESVMFFPSTSSDSLLCRDRKIHAYYAKSEWKRDWQPKIVCILRNQYANVNDLALFGSGERTFDVNTSATDPENDVLTYSYIVTAGRIIGQGPKVVWDLTGVKAGEYSITVGVDDGAGIVGKTVTKTVVIR
jgi:hypothetical protein